DASLCFLWPVFQQQTCPADCVTLISMRRTIIAVLCITAFAMAQDKTSLPDLARLKQMSARFAPIPLKVDQSGLSTGDRAALAKLIEAARIVNQLFMQQMWNRNLQVYQSLQSDKS